MSTLAEIENVVDRLSLAEQEQLLLHLEQKVRHRRSASTSREEWILRLESLRESLASGTAVQTSESLLGDLRED